MAKTLSLSLILPPSLIYLFACFFYSVTQTLGNLRGTEAHHQGLIASFMFLSKTCFIVGDLMKANLSTILFSSTSSIVHFFANLFSSSLYIFRLLQLRSCSSPFVSSPSACINSTNTNAIITSTHTSTLLLSACILCRHISFFTLDQTSYNMRADASLWQLCIKWYTSSILMKFKYVVKLNTLSNFFLYM